MTTVNIRRQGDTAIMTVPAEVLKALRIGVGSKLEIAVNDGSFTARPKAKHERRRYLLYELLRGATPRAMRRLNGETAWARNGDPFEREF